MQVPDEFRKPVVDLLQRGYKPTPEDGVGASTCSSVYGAKWITGAVVGAVGAWSLVRAARSGRYPRLGVAVEKFAPATVYITASLAGGYLSGLRGKDDCLKILMRVDSPLGDVLRKQAQVTHPHLFRELPLELQEKVTRGDGPFAKSEDKSGAAPPTAPSKSVKQPEERRKDPWWEEKDQKKPQKNDFKDDDDDDDDFRNGFDDDEERERERKEREEKVRREQRRRRDSHRTRREDDDDEDNDDNRFAQRESSSSRWGRNSNDEENSRWGSSGTSRKF